MNNALAELKNFIESWSETPEQNKKAFLELKAHLEAKPGVRLEFHPREGVTYSLRATHPAPEAARGFSAQSPRRITGRPAAW